jgi:hypothetical protein
VFGDSVERRRAAGAADDGAHLRRPLDERPAHRRAHQSVRTGHHDDRRGSGHVVHTASGRTVAPGLQVVAASGQEACATARERRTSLTWLP